MAKYLKPGVYSEEIPSVSVSKSIENVENKVVFIGYTEKAVDDKGTDLSHQLHTIHSLAEFENIFGFAQNEDHLELLVESSGVTENLSVHFIGPHSLHNLYYSVKSFFDQGADVCEIISIGPFKDLGEPLILADFTLGIGVLNSNQNALLLIIPENQNLEKSDFYHLQNAILTYCEANKNFAFLDVPKISPPQFEDEIGDYRNHTTGAGRSFGAAFFPNLVTNYPYQYDPKKLKIRYEGKTRILEKLREENEQQYKKYKRVLDQYTIVISPLGGVSGSIAKNDQSKGIWKIPANIPLIKIVSPEISISQQQAEQLTIDHSFLAVNAIRQFEQNRCLIWGFRTLDYSQPENKYINQKRFTNVLLKTVTQYLSDLSSNQNTALLHKQVRTALENYLHQFFMKGAFVGQTSREAYFVRCAYNETMTAQDQEKGILIINFGVALLKPAEFFIFNLSQQMAKIT